MTKRKPIRLPVPPTGFYSMARRNLGGAKRIVSTLGSEDERNTDPSVQFLLGWAIEGYLKAFLAAHGILEPELRYEIGHDLIEALDRAKARGLSFGGMGRLQFVVGHIAPAHLSMHWRYLPTNVDKTERCFTMVWPSLAFPALDDLDRAIWPYVQEAMNCLLNEQGKPPVAPWRAVFSHPA